MWDIEKIIRKGDYNYCIVRNHPNRTKNDYVLHHRVVLENHLGRLLQKDEIVHHKDGNRLNNVVENLEILDDKQHALLHAKESLADCVKLKCPICKRVFNRRRFATHLVKDSPESRYTTCSKDCLYSARRLINSQGITASFKEAIAENILLEYKGKVSQKILPSLFEE